MKNAVKVKRKAPRTTEERLHFILKHGPREARSIVTRYVKSVYGLCINKPRGMSLEDYLKAEVRKVL